MSPYSLIAFDRDGGGVLTWLLVFPYLAIRAPWLEASELAAELRESQRCEKEAWFARHKRDATDECGLSVRKGDDAKLASSTRQGQQSGNHPTENAAQNVTGLPRIPPRWGQGAGYGQSYGMQAHLETRRDRRPRF